MSAKPPAVGFMYVETDIPPGLTIDEWRAHRAAERATQRRAERWPRSWMPLLVSAVVRYDARALPPRAARPPRARRSLQRGVTT